MWPRARAGGRASGCVASSVWAISRPLPGKHFLKEWDFSRGVVTQDGDHFLFALAWLEPKPRDLTIGKAALKFDPLVRDRQVIANESFSVSRFMFKMKSTPSVSVRLQPHTIAA